MGVGGVLLSGFLLVFLFVCCCLGCFCFMFHSGGSKIGSQGQRTYGSLDGHQKGWALDNNMNHKSKMLWHMISKTIFTLVKR